MWLLLAALFGLLVPNGFFIHWLLTGDKSLDAVLGNELALGFILDCALAMVLLAWLFAVRPIGRVRWPWFVVLSLAGGLGFSIPLYLWLNRRSSGDPKASFGAWWRGVRVGLLVAATATSAGSVRAAELRRFTLDDEVALRTINDVEVSPDGARVAYTVSTPSLEKNEHQVALYVVASDGGEPRRLGEALRILNTPLPAPRLRWSPDGAAIGLLAIAGEKPQAFAVPLEGEPRVVRGPLADQLRREGHHAPSPSARRERSAGAGRGSVEDVPIVEVTRKDGGAVRLPARRARDVRAGASA